MWSCIDEFLVYNVIDSLLSQIGFLLRPHTPLTFSWHTLLKVLFSPDFASYVLSLSFTGFEKHATELTGGL